MPELSPRESMELISFLKSHVHDKNGTLLSLCISGSTLYGWDSHDSDIDVRGCYALDRREFLGIGNPKLVLKPKFKDYDIELQEIKKEVYEGGIKSNCTFLEHIYAPQIYKHNEYPTIANTIKNSWTAQVYGSYNGMASFNYKKFIAQGRNTVKKYLYVFRGLLSGRYALDHGIIEPNLEKLLKYYRVPLVKDLLKIKREGKENEPLKILDSGELDNLIIKQFAKLDEAKDNTNLPERIDDETRNILNACLVDLRLNLGENR